MLVALKKRILKVVDSYKINKQKKAIINSNHNILKVDKVFDARKYGFSFSESAIYCFPKNDYREYINTWEAYQPRLNDTKNFIVSDDKLLFSVVMKNYVEVAEVYALVIDGNVNSIGEYDLTNETLYDFFLSNNGGVLKDRGGYNGFEIYVFCSNGNELTRNETIVTKEQFAEILKNTKNGLIQRRLVQGKFENDIFDKAVNTVRLITMRKKDSLEHEVVAAVQRIGTSRTNAVDNFAQGGGSALIDIETGVMSAMTSIDSFDENGVRTFFSKHPDTGAQIEGVMIPNWENIKATIIEITRKLPLFSYIAWDIVVKDDGIAVIETNMKSSLDVFQVHGGMRNTLLGKKYAEKGYIKK